MAAAMMVDQENVEYQPKDMAMKTVKWKFVPACLAPWLYLTVPAASAVQATIGEPDLSASDSYIEAQVKICPSQAWQSASYVTTRSFTSKASGLPIRPGGPLRHRRHLRRGL